VVRTSARATGHPRFGTGTSFGGNTADGSPVTRGKPFRRGVSAGTEGFSLVQVHVARVGELARDVVKVLREVSPRLSLGRMGAVPFHGVVSGFAELVVRVRGSRIVNDGGPLRQQPVEVQVIEGRQQLAVGDVTSPDAPKMTTVWGGSCLVCVMLLEVIRRPRSHVHLT